MHDRTTPIGSFLDAAAARQPAPGGGSVSALVGALAASMGEMVLNYSVGKKGLEAHQDELKTVLAELTRARELMLGLMEEDQRAYAALTAARKLPADSPERRTDFAAALVASIRTPQAMGAAALAVLELCERVATKVNRFLLSDLAVCADLAVATVRCAVYNVKANLPDVPDPAERDAIERAPGERPPHSVEVVMGVSPASWNQNTAAH